MLSFTWDTQFEQTPTGAASRSIIDDQIRRIKKGTRERMEPEHEWGPYSDKNSGIHRGGVTKVSQIGVLAERDALAEMREGSLFIVDESDDIRISYYNGSEWIGGLTTLVHNNLQDNTVGDPHPQYCTLSFAGDGILNANGYKVGLVDPESSNVLTWDHYGTIHAHAPLDDPNMLSDRALGQNLIKCTQKSYTSHLNETYGQQGTDVYTYSVFVTDNPILIRKLKFVEVLSVQSSLNSVGFYADQFGGWNVRVSVTYDYNGAKYEAYLYTEWLELEDV